MSSKLSLPVYQIGADPHNLLLCSSDEIRSELVRRPDGSKATKNGTRAYFRGYVFTTQEEVAEKGLSALLDAFKRGGRATCPEFPAVGSFLEAPLPID